MNKKFLIKHADMGLCRPFCLSAARHLLPIRWEKNWIFIDRVSKIGIESMRELALVQVSAQNNQMNMNDTGEPLGRANTRVFDLNDFQAEFIIKI